MTPTAPFTGRVCITGPGATGEAVHYHAYVERVTGRLIILRRRADGRPHRFRAEAPHTGVPGNTAGRLTLHPRCAHKPATPDPQTA